MAKSETVGASMVGGGGGQGERTHLERTCGGKLFPHFVLSKSNTRDLH